MKVHIQVVVSKNSQLGTQGQCEVIYGKRNPWYLTLNILIRNAHGPYVKTVFQCLPEKEQHLQGYKLKRGISCLCIF